MKLIKQLFCSHEWSRTTNYCDMFFDVCEKCGKLRDTNKENIQTEWWCISCGKLEPMEVKYTEECAICGNKVE